MVDRVPASKCGLTRALTVAIVLALLVPAGAAAQAQPAAAKAPVQAWTKKMPDGQPDLQGYWSSTTNTPLERNVNCGTKEFWTDERGPLRPAAASAAEPVDSAGAPLQTTAPPMSTMTPPNSD
ncbi:MAG: hypothetical protein HYU27_04535 [Acidobacteria bacterium]|nr:hypothetical protein [Acidobacteriota bacterium]